MPVEESKKDFKDVQNEYDHLFKTEGIRDDDRAYKWHATQVLKLKPGLQSMLDVACGAGYFLREMISATNGALKAVGTDISPVGLEMAKKECPSAEYQECVAEELPFEDNRFDAITCLGSMEHFIDIPKAIREMRRVAKSEAIFYILVPNILWYKDILSVLFTGIRKTRNQTHERFASMGEWKELLESQGLTVQAIKKYNGIAKYGWKQFLKDLLIPVRFSYHFIYICK